MEYASRMYEIASAELADVLNYGIGRDVVKQMPSPERFELIQQVYKSSLAGQSPDTISLYGLINFLASECRTDLLELRLGDIVNNWPSRLPMLIMRHRFEAVTTGNYNAHLCLADAYAECRQVDCRTVRGHVEHLMADGRLTLEKSPTDGRKSMLVPAGDLMLHYVTIKVASWFHRIQLHRENGLPEQSKRTRDFLRQLGVSEKACNEAREARFSSYALAAE